MDEQGREVGEAGSAVGSVGNLLGGCRAAQQAVEVGVEDGDRVLDREDADEHVGREAVGEGDEHNAVFGQLGTTGAAAVVVPVVVVIAMFGVVAGLDVLKKRRRG